MTAQIELTKGYSSTIDRADFDAVSANSWHASMKSGRPYAQASIKRDGKHRSVMLHRWLLGANDGQVVDHINGNTLDNRRSNLRVATHPQNASNKRTSSSLGFTGIRKAGSGWGAYIAPDGTDIALGTYKTKEQAAAAYNAAAKAVYGDFARLNAVPFNSNLLAEIVESKRVAVRRLDVEISILECKK